MSSLLSYTTKSRRSSHLRWDYLIIEQLENGLKCLIRSNSFEQSINQTTVLAQLQLNVNDLKSSKPWNVILCFPSVWPHFEGNPQISSIIFTLCGNLWEMLINNKGWEAGGPPVDRQTPADWPISASSIWKRGLMLGSLPDLQVQTLERTEELSCSWQHLQQTSNNPLSAEGPACTGRHRRQ